MATFSISATARKAQASGNGSAGPFSFAFQVNSQSEVDVFVDTTLKTLTTHYTVSLASNGTGTVSFTTNNFPSSSQTITIMGDAPLSRTSVYTSGGNITAAALESDFDTNVMVQQQQQEVLSRTVKAPVDDAASVDLTLPNKDDRKGKVLGFNSTSGNPEVTTQVTGAAVNVSTVSVGGNATATVALSGGTATFALGIPTGATGATGATGQAGGGLANIVSDTTPQLGGNLDMNGKDIVTTSNATLDLAPNGTGTVVVRGNTNSGAVVFNCESNSHGQKVFGQPHSASVTNTLMLPAGANSTLLSRVSIDTLTNKTLTSPKINENVAVTATATEINKLTSSGVLKQAGKESIWVPAAAMYPSTTNPCSDLTQVETTALRPDLKVLDFAAAADDFAQFAIAFPKSWNEGTVTYQPFWTVTGTNTGTMVWQLGGIAVSSDDTINTAFGSLVGTTALAHSGTSNDLMVSAESGAVTIAGSPAANDLCFFQINNDASASGQTGVARLLGVKFFFTTDAANDA